MEEVVLNPDFLQLELISALLEEVAVQHQEWLVVEMEAVVEVVLQVQSLLVEWLVLVL
jgi:hypothetical protein